MKGGRKKKSQHLQKIQRDIRNNQHICVSVNTAGTAGSTARCDFCPVWKLFLLTFTNRRFLHRYGAQQADFDRIKKVMLLHLIWQRDYTAAGFIW